MSKENYRSLKGMMNTEKNICQLTIRLAEKQGRRMAGGEGVRNKRGLVELFR